jgi:hypothetical protein
MKNTSYKKRSKLNILAFAKFQAMLFGLIGLLLGILYSFGGLILDISVSMNWLQSEETLGLSHGTFLAFGALILMPLIEILIRFFTEILEALLYNI